MKVQTVYERDCDQSKDSFNVSLTFFPFQTHTQQQLMVRPSKLVMKFPGICQLLNMQVYYFLHGHLITD